MRMSVLPDKLYIVRVQRMIYVLCSDVRRWSELGGKGGDGCKDGGERWATNTHELVINIYHYSGQTDLAALSSTRSGDAIARAQRPAKVKNEACILSGRLKCKI
jgi:hypothetical protein